MAKSKKKKDAEPSEQVSTDSGIVRSALRQLYRPVTLATAAIVVCVAMLWPSVRRYIPDLASRAEYRLETAKIRITQPPRWVPTNLVEQVSDQANLPAELSLLEPNVLRDVAEAFALHPWVEEVVSVRKSFPAAIDVELTYRRPVAMVQVRQGVYPVDPSGVLLPPHDFSAADSKNYPQISGVLSTPQGPAGTDWGDPVVTDAAQLASELAPNWKKFSLAAIVCPRSISPDDGFDAGVYELRTAGGSEIVWGHGPNSDHPGELTTAQKVERLEKYAAKFGGLDQPQGRFRIDIRHHRDIRRVPLAADGSFDANLLR